MSRSGLLALRWLWVLIGDTPLRNCGWRTRLCLGVLLLHGCGSPQPLGIGVVLDDDGARGALLAAKDINAAGGIRGQPLHLHVIRGLSSTSARDALTAADSLATDQDMLAVVGHTNSSASIAAAQVYNEHHITQIAPTTTAPVYSEAGPYSFRLVASDVHQGAFLGELILADSSRSRTALLYVNDDYGRALRATFVQSLAAHGIAPAYEAPYAEAAGFTDVADVASAIARSKAQVLVWVGRSAELQILLPPLRKLVPAIRVIASDGFGGPRSADFRSQILLGVRYVRFVDLDSTPRTRLLIARNQQENAQFTDQFPLAYDAVMLLAEAIRSAGPDRERIRDYVAGLGTARPAFAGITGPISFDRNRNPPPSYHLKEVTATGSRAISLPPGMQRIP